MSAAVAHRAPSAGRLAGLWLLTRLAIRRSRVFYPGWTAALVVIVLATEAAYETVVPPGAGVEMTMTALAGNPTMRAMLGPPFDLMNGGGFTMWRSGTFTATALAFVAAFGVIRATRAEEEDGRTELLRAAVVGRHSPLTAALLVAAGFSLLNAVLVIAGLGNATGDVAGALAMGAGLGLTGLAGAGLGAVAAQVSVSARGARGLVGAVLGGAYLLRAVADGSARASGAADLGWVSPLQWAALVRPFAGERWWVLTLPAALAVALVALAYRLEAARDHGAGLRASSTGPARGRIGSAGGLSWRLHRASLTGWTAGVVVFGLAMGSLSDAFGTMLEDLPQLAEVFRRMGGGADVLRDAFYVAMLGLVAIVLAILGVQLLGVLHREEDRSHAELLLSTATSRWRLALSHLVPALLAPTGLLVGCGGLLGLGQGLAESSAAPVLGTAWAALVLAPGMWVCVGVSMVVHGWWPRGLVLGPLLVGWSLVISWFGSILDLPEWVLDLTPWAALPTLPVEPMAWIPVLVTTAVAVVLCTAGLAGYRRRDLG